MENTVATPDLELGIQQDDAAATAADYVDIGALMNEPESPTVASDPVATDQPTQDDAAKGGKGFLTQEDFDKALGERLQRERTRHESTPEYLLGQQLIRERAAREGITPQEAYQRIRNDHVQQKAEQYAKDPKAFYADYLTQQYQPQQTPPTFNQPVSAASLTQQLIDAGAPSMGFQPHHITAQFAADAQQYGVQAALAFWQRSQQAAPQRATEDAVIAQIEQRKRAPQPIRPTTNGGAVPSHDYQNMSSEDFQKLEAALKQATLDGRRVRL